jgi:hypothetical protein
VAGTSGTRRTSGINGEAGTRERINGTRSTNGIMGTIKKSGLGLREKIAQLLERSAINICWLKL